MFSFLKKKSKSKVCNHKWKDFPWYLAISYYDTERYYSSPDYRYTLKVVEPYVCIKCKDRRDEVLMTYESNSREKRDAKVKELQQTYPDKIRPIVEIEDMVKDEQLVDREYLKLLEQFENPADMYAGLNLFDEIQKAKREVEAIGVVERIGEK